MHISNLNQPIDNVTKCRISSLCGRRRRQRKRTTIKKKVGAHRITEIERWRKSKNHFIWLGKSVVERKLFGITCGKMELHRRKQTVCGCVEGRDSRLLLLLLLNGCLSQWSTVFLPFVSFALVQGILFTVTREHATQTV